MARISDSSQPKYNVSTMLQEHSMRSGKLNATSRMKIYRERITSEDLCEIKIKTVKKYRVKLKYSDNKLMSHKNRTLFDPILI